MSKQEDLSKGVAKTIRLCISQGFNSAEITREVLQYEAKNNVGIKVEGELPSVEVKRTAEENWYPYPLKVAYVTAQQDMLKTGFTAWEPLIEDGK